MNCLAFPKMFKGNQTLINSDYAATSECIHLLLSSEVGTLFGDPDFGLKLKKYTFHQNNYILRDILIDEIYTQISTFCPQVYLERKNIQITQEGSKLYATIQCKNQSDFTTNTYNLVLLDDEEK